MNQFYRQNIVPIRSKLISYDKLLFYLVSDKSCGCTCPVIEIISEGKTSKATEYKDGELIDIDHSNSLDPKHWEEMLLDSLNSTYLRNNLASNKPSDRILGRVVDVDLQYQNYTVARHNLTFWESYKKLLRSTNLRYKDLLGSYELYECKEYNIFGRISRYPVYRKILSDGTEAFLFKNKFGTEWQVEYNCIQ